MSTFEAKQRERDEARKASVEARRLEKEREGREEENPDYFAEQFSAKVKAIEELIEAAKSLPETERAAHFDGISEDFSTLHRMVSDSTLFLAAFDLKTAKKRISQLYSQFTTAQNQLVPKKKFSFKPRPKKTIEPTKPSADTDDLAQSGEQRKVPPSVAALVDVDKNQTRFSSKENETISPTNEEVGSRDVNLSDLRNCEVKLVGAPLSLHINNLDSCHVLCGPVSSSVFIDNCKNCTFVVACQQLRVHTTVGSVFYLHVTSRAIIEDCRELRFAPYNLSYPQLHSHFKESGLNERINNWDKVDDFNWLVTATPSPNWTLLSPEDRTTSWELSSPN